MVRPTRFVVRGISVRAMAPAVSGFQGLAFLHDGVAALAGVEGAISGDAGDLLIGRYLVEQFGQ